MLGQVAEGTIDSCMEDRSFSRLCGAGFCAPLESRTTCRAFLTLLLGGGAAAHRGVCRGLARAAAAGPPFNPPDIAVNMCALKGERTIMTKLGVNIDHVATIREARKTDEPDPVWAAVEAELGGADCITFHLREDRRHIHDRDAEVLRHTVGVKLNMEMSIAPEIVKIAQRLKPDQCTLVPEKREEITTEGGLDVVRLKRRIKPVVQKLKRAGIDVSAFIEPVPAQIEASAKCGFDAIELWTGGYANARDQDEREHALEALSDGLEAGYDSGLIVLGGHGLTYRNLEAVAMLGDFAEFNIGHSIIARAAFVGVREAVREMKRLIDQACDRAAALPMEGMLFDDYDEE